MLYWKQSPNRVLFLNEYWIFLPTMVVFNVIFISRTRSKRARIEELKSLIAQIEREKKIRKILLLSLGVSGCAHLLTRGGSTDFLNLIDTDYIRAACNITEGVNYLDDHRIRNIIADLYRHKSKGKIIYITATAVCHIVNRYGQTFLALPFAVGDFGLTSLYQTLRKLIVTILLGAVGPLYISSSGVIGLILALIFGVSGLRLAFNNLDYIPTSPVDFTTGLKPRIPGITDVVIINNNRDKIILRDPVQENQECWLPDQRLLNPNCKIKPHEIPDAIDSGLLELRYEDTVNMQDVTGLPRQEFTDKFDLGQTETEPSICKPGQGKTVNFLDKFGDSEQISKSEEWDTCDNEFMVPEKRYLRTRN